MSSRPCSLLTLAPYRFLPPANGGHLGIAMMHEHLGRHCEDHIAGTSDNGPATDWHFQLHRVLGTGPLRYLPLRFKAPLVRLGLQYDATALWCEHPYLAVTAAAAARALGKPWFLRSHNIESERFRELGKKWWKGLAAYEGWAMKKADGVFFVTSEDRDFAQKRWNLDPARCHVAPYGTPLESTPERPADPKRALAEAWNARADVPWLYFLGALDYAPNVQALHLLTDEVAPRLQQSGQAFELFVAGKGLSTEDAQRLAASGIRYTGFLPSLDAFLDACDVMLNPVVSGGGIKTKAVEALAWGKPVVSTQSGAAGLLRPACGDALTVVGDADWEGFVAGTVAAMRQPAVVPDSFYQTYAWSAIAQQVLQAIGQTTPQIPRKKA